VDADPDVEAVVAVCRLHFGAEPLAEVEQGEAAAHRPLGIVFPGFVGAEGGQDVVAGVLQDLAGVCLDDGRPARQRVVHDGADRLRVEVLGERGRADHVEEEDADLPQGLLRHGRRCSRDGQRRQPGPRRRQQRIDHGIAQRRALTFQGGDRGFELLLLGHRSPSAPATPGGSARADR
jgi:hypothetical protein